MTGRIVAWERAGRRHQCAPPQVGRTGRVWECEFCWARHVYLDSGQWRRAGLGLRARLRLAQLWRWLGR